MLHGHTITKAWVFSRIKDRGLSLWKESGKNPESFVPLALSSFWSLFHASPPMPQDTSLWIPGLFISGSSEQCFWAGCHMLPLSVLEGKAGVSWGTEDRHT